MIMTQIEKEISCTYQTVLFFFPKEVKLNSIRYLIMKIHNKRKLQQSTINHSANYRYFIKIYRKCTSEQCYFLTIDTTLRANNSLGFRKSLLDLLYKGD